MLFLEVSQIYLGKGLNPLLLNDPFTFQHNPQVICIDKEKHKYLKTYEEAKKLNLTVLKVIPLSCELQKFDSVIDGCTPNHFNRHYDKFTLL